MPFEHRTASELPDPTHVVGERPPGALTGWRFEDRCVRCGDCTDVCPQQVIAVDARGYPVLAHPEDCGTCGLCADVCVHSAIELTPATRATLQVIKVLERRGPAFL